MKLKFNLSSFLKRKGKDEKEQPKKSERRKALKFSCVRLTPKCCYSGNEVLQKPKGKCISFVLRDYAVRISEKPQGYAVKDQSGKWVCYVPRKTGDVPVFPFLIEYAREAVEKEGAAALFLLLETPCGLARIKVNPQLSLKERLQIEVLEREKLSNGKVNYQNVLKLHEIAESFKRKPFLVLTNSEAIRNSLLVLIERIAKEEGLGKAEQFVRVLPDPLSEVLSTAGSSNVHVPRKAPTKLIALALLLLAAAGAGFYFYQKQQEEMEQARLRLMAQQQQAKQWTPSPVFKREHIGYYFLARSKAVKEAEKALFPPEGFKLKSLSIGESGISAVYETPYIVEGGVKKNGTFVLERKVSVPSFRWEDARGKPPLVIPPMKAVVRRFSKFVQSVGSDSIDGVSLLSAEVSGNLELSPADLEEFLKKVEKTPFVVRQLTVNLKDSGLYAVQFSGKIYGLREEQ